MVGLLDIAPQSETVCGIKVVGISAKGIAVLLARFPTLVELMKGKGSVAGDIQTMAPDAIAAIITIGCGNSGDEAAETIAENLPVETQLDFLEAIGRLTFPKGFRPFAERIKTMAAVVSGESGKTRDMKSRVPSKPLSQVDTVTRVPGI